MTTIRKILSYDDVEDNDIHEWLESLPQRQQSKHIRIAIRTYLNYLREQEEENESTIIPKRKSPVHMNVAKGKQKTERVEEQKQKLDKSEDDNQFVDLDENFIDDLGK